MADLTDFERSVIVLDLLFVTAVPKMATLTGVCTSTMLTIITVYIKQEKISSVKLK